MKTSKQGQVRSQLRTCDDYRIARPYHTVSPRALLHHSVDSTTLRVRKADHVDHRNSAASKSAKNQNGTAGPQGGTCYRASSSFTSSFLISFSATRISHVSAPGTNRENDDAERHQQGRLALTFQFRLHIGAVNYHVDLITVQRPGYDAALRRCSAIPVGVTQHSPC